MAEARCRAPEPPAPRGLAGAGLGHWRRACWRKKALALTGRQREALVEAVVSELVGLGPLEPLLQDAGITEIMVNGPDQVYVEREGRLLRAEAAFDDAAHLMRIIERILSPLGRRVDESSPMADGRLADGSRVNVILPPLAVNGPILTIRKFARQPLTMPSLASARHAHAAGRRLSARLCRGPSEHSGFRRNGQRQDDHAERPVVVYPGG